MTRDDEKGLGFVRGARTTICGADTWDDHL